MKRPIPDGWFLYFNDYLDKGVSRCDRASLRVIVNEQMPAVRAPSGATTASAPSAAPAGGSMHVSSHTPCIDTTPHGRAIEEDRIARAGSAASARSASASSASWTEQLVADLAERTCNGTIARGTNLTIRHFPIPQKLAAARAELARKGVKFDIQPLPSEDGSFQVWVEYIPNALRSV